MDAWLTKAAEAIGIGEALRPDEREAADAGRLHRRARREQRRPPARLREDRVGVEPAGLRVPDPRDERLGVAALEVALERRATLLVIEALLQNAETALVLRMAGVRMRLCERWMAQDVDERTAAASSSTLLPSRAAASPTR